MKPLWPVTRNTPTGAKRVFGWFVLGLLIVSSGLLSWSRLHAQTSAPGHAVSKTQAPDLTSAQLSHISSDQLTHYVFENHGCKSCHSLGSDGKLGFTDRGKELGKGFEGCVTLLTSMNMISLVKETDRSPAEKNKVARFEEFGCTTCHQIVPGKMGLTKYGVKLKSMHLPCTETCCPR